MHPARFRAANRRTSSIVVTPPEAMIGNGTAAASSAHGLDVGPLHHAVAADVGVHQARPTATRHSAGPDPGPATPTLPASPAWPPGRFSHRCPARSCRETCRTSAPASRATARPWCRSRRGRRPRKAPRQCLFRSAGRRRAGTARRQLEMLRTLGPLTGRPSRRRRGRQGADRWPLRRPNDVPWRRDRPRRPSLADNLPAAAGHIGRLADRWRAEFACPSLV